MNSQTQKERTQTQSTNQERNNQAKILALY